MNDDGPAATATAPDQAPGPAPAPGILASLLAPISVGDFLADTWGRTHRFIHRRDPDHFQNLFTLGDIDRCISIGRHHAKVILSLIGALGSGQPSSQGPITENSLQKAYQGFSEGNTLRIVGLESIWPPITEMTLALSAALGGVSHTNAYLTPPSSQGFAAHFDYHDVFILQVSGAKEWFVYDPDRDHPVDLEYAKVWNATDADESKLHLRERALLMQGDLLYIPRGYYHKALTSELHSLHLTISVDPLCWVTVLQKALEIACVDLGELRYALPPDFLSRPEKHHDLEATFRSLLELFARSASYDKTVARLQGRKHSPLRHPPDGHFNDLAALPEIGSQSLLERRAGMRCESGREGSEAYVDFGWSRVKGPADLAPAFDFVRERTSFRVHELPGTLTENSRITLARRLVRDGLLRIVEA